MTKVDICCLGLTNLSIYLRSANKGQLRVGQESIPGKHFLPIEDNLIPEELESNRRCIGRAATVFLDCFIAGNVIVEIQLVMF